MHLHFTYNFDLSSVLGEQWKHATEQWNNGSMQRTMEAAEQWKHAEQWNNGSMQAAEQWKHASSRGKQQNNGSMQAAEVSMEAAEPWKHTSSKTMEAFKQQITNCHHVTCRLLCNTTGSAQQAVERPMIT